MNTPNNIFRFISIFILYLLITSFESLPNINSKFIASSNYDSINDSLVISSKKINQGKVIVSFENKGLDTLYLFSSYFKKDKYFNSKYLNRISRKKKEKKLSFLPLAPYLSMVNSDRIVIGENSVVKKNQIEFEFIELIPNSKQEIIFFTNDDIDFFTKDINPKNINIYDKIKWRVIKNDNKTINYKKKIEFGVYKKIDKIVNHDTFTRDPLLYNALVRDFKVYYVDY